GPTAGLDVGATEAIHRILLEQRDAGMGVLLISEDLDELMMICDRIAVLYEGRVVGVVDAEGADRERLGLMMTGSPA
ncbi:MAG: heme ABC transporter ATP-binding protein, partial [Actinomycetota bacterium]